MTNPAHILLVDDDVELAGLLRDYLVRDGFTAEAVPDGESGVAAALSGRFAIVVLDVMMPGMSGYEVASAIRADTRYAAVRLVALTGWGGEADRERTAQTGFDAHLTKPATVEAVEDVLRHMT